MPEQYRDVPDRGEATYRMSELVAASGVSRDMIKYYLRANLLPTPHKPRPNLSLYNDNHLALIRLIQHFQDRTKLSLTEIAGVFSAAGHDANAIELELLSDKYSVSLDDNIIPLPAVAEDGRALSLPPEFLRELAGASLLPDRDSPDQKREQLASLLWAAYRQGVPLEFFRKARKKLAELAELEVKALIAIKRPGVNFSAMVEEITQTDRVINRWVVAEKNYQARHLFRRVLENSERAISTLLDLIYRPSRVFRQRYRTDDILARLRTAFEANPGAPRKAHDLCLATLLLAEHSQTIATAEEALATDPHDSVSIAFISLAHGLQNNADEAFRYSCHLQEDTTQHPVALQARLLSLLLRAVKLGGVTDTSEMMKRAGELFLELAAEPAGAHPEITLLLARANIAFPEFANDRTQAIDALHSLLQRLDDNAQQVLGQSLEDLQIVYRIYAHYYLGLLHDAEGDQASAVRCFQQVLQLDPASNFGENAYLRLGQSQQ
ncbi:MAG: MerR family transcriptional regulator [Halioglobus sp.]|nr:MerR family transcriptional regulator [Halioglobus sp.]